MPENRFFLNTPFAKNKVGLLENEEYRHLKVMRCKIGDIIELVNGKNQLAKALITHLDKRSAEVTLTEIASGKPLSRQLILAQALLKPKNLELVIEKGTELGATAFWLFPGDLSEKKTLTKTQLERLRHITISALKQSGQLILPALELLPPLSKWTILPPNPHFGEIGSKRPLQPSDTDITLIIGPEKGFSDAEIKHLRTMANGISLNANTLRAETAALAALAIVSKPDVFI